MQKKKAFCDEERSAGNWETLPSHEQTSQEVKMRLWQGLCERISKLHAGINLLNHNTSIFDGCMEMMPFDPNVFSVVKLIWVIYQFQAASIVFVYC